MIVVSKSKPLKGYVDICGAKNAALPIMAACIAVEGCVCLENMPKLSDTDSMALIIEELGGRVTEEEHKRMLCCESVNETFAPEHLTRLLRGSFLVCGPLLARMGRAKVALPGGCRIGARPVDLHIKGFSALGANIEFDNGYVVMNAEKLKGSDIYLDFPSVGATENLLIAATLAEGQTVITNAATEPEVADLAVFLTKCGAEISGIGTEQIIIDGVDELHGCSHKIIGDRIEAGTYMIASAITGGDITIYGADVCSLNPVISKLREMGASITDSDGALRVVGGEIKSVNIKTMPHPGFPTDMQAQFSALMSVSDGTGVITETVFENRFMHISELMRMRADITIDGRNAVISGKKALTGCKVTSHDLRGGAALVLAGLAADGTTSVENSSLIERGYENFVPKLQSLGAEIEYR